MVPLSVEEILRRLRILERKVDDLEKLATDSRIEDSDLRGELNQLRTEFTNMKDDVMGQIANFTEKVWKLIFVLVFIIALLAGVKEVPKLW